MTNHFKYALHVIDKNLNDEESMLETDNIYISTVWFFKNIFWYVRK